LRGLREFVVEYMPNALLEKLEFVTHVTDVTDKPHGETEKWETEEKLTVHSKRDMCDIRDQEEEPDFLWRIIPEAERCELCGKAPVSYEI